MGMVMADVRAMMARAIAQRIAKREHGESYEGFESYDGERGEDFADAALAALGAAGWQCVPKVATEEMLRAAGASPDGVRPRGGIDWLGRMLPKYWTAMLAAAPKVAP